MATISAQLSMSLDGFVALPDDSVGPLFDWYDAGEVEVRWPGNDMVSRVAPASARHLEEIISGTGALVVGRRVFDHTDGWAGSHPVGTPVFVVTHRPADEWVERHSDAPFTFVPEGVERAVALAAEVAGTATVGVAGPSIAQQCLRSGLLDEVRIDLAPVLLGGGIRFFVEGPTDPILLDDPDVVVSERVTHLRYRVLR
jgi:dihydrofolate reductase